MEFKAYPKIMRLGKEETDGILDVKLTVQEKVDGANVSIWLADGKLCFGSRTRQLPDDESFNGFGAAVKANTAILHYLEQYPHRRLYGEWLVKHTITYPDEAYRKIYLYDVYDHEIEDWLDQPAVKEIATLCDIEYPQIFVQDVIITEAEIKEFVGKSFIGPQGEGVVLKADFTNRFGDKVYAKVVHEKFKESNAIVFGGNNKHSETYWEMYVVNKYCTVARVQKIMNKLQPMQERRLHMEETSKVAGTCYHDLIQEEAWEIVKKVPALNFKKLQSLCMRKFIQIYHDILNNSLSIADGGGDAEKPAEAN